MQNADKWKTNGKAVTHVRLDNAGENYLLQKHCNSHNWMLILTWEFTSRNTTTKFKASSNGHDDHSKCTQGSTIQAPQRSLERASKLDWLTPISIDGVIKSQYKHWMGELLNFMNHMRVWGETGMVTYTKGTSAKHEDLG